MGRYQPFDRRARGRAELRLGFPVRVATPGGGFALVLAASHAEDRWIDALFEASDERVVLVITRRRADTLRIRAYDGAFARIPLARGVRAPEVVAIVDPVRDLATPMKGPFPSLRGGDTEAERGALEIVRDAGLLPAALCAPIGDDPPEWVGDCAIVSQLDPEQPPPPERIANARLPLRAAPESRVHLFRDPRSGDEHVALEIGTPAPGTPPLVRVHSSCFTGDLLGSLRCDCGDQLAAAIGRMGAGEGGVVVVLQQEGRGIGLANKIRAYQLQDQGFDTFEANRRLGFEEDERDFSAAAAILRALGITAIRLLSSNPDKGVALAAAGIEIRESVPLEIPRNPHNEAYLAAKSRRFTEGT